MIRALLKYCIFSVLALLPQLSPSGAGAAQSIALSTPLVTVNEDSGTWRRNPFTGGAIKDKASPSKAVPHRSEIGDIRQEPDIIVQGIMQVDKAFHALINGRIVKAGDTIQGITVKEISRFKVVVLTERKEKIIYDIYQGRINRGKQ